MIGTSHRARRALLFSLGRSILLSAFAILTATPASAVATGSGHAGSPPDGVLSPPSDFPKKRGRDKCPRKRARGGKPTTWGLSSLSQKGKGQATSADPGYEDVTLGGDTGGTWLKGDFHMHGLVDGHPPPKVDAAIGAPKNESQPTKYGTFEKMVKDFELFNQTNNGQQWPPTIIPFPGLVGIDYLKHKHDSVLIWGDKLFDQAVASTWAHIFTQLQNRSFDFAFFLTHDLEGQKVNIDYKEFCNATNMICARGREYRKERSESCLQRLDYLVQCVGNGLHSADFHGTGEGVGELEEFIIALHPNALPKDRLRDEYYANRQGNRVNGTELGTACRGCPSVLLPGQTEEVQGNTEQRTTTRLIPYNDQLHAFEVFCAWFPRLDPTASQTPEEAKPQDYSSGFTPRDKEGTFAVNKWDSALSRGEELFATSSADAFAKASPWNQLKMLREKGGACPQNDQQCAFDVRAVPAGGGFVKVWMPRGMGRDKKNLMAQVRKGHFYAVASNNPEKAKEIIVTKVETKVSGMKYTVTLKDAEKVDCYAVANHGRVVSMTNQGSTFTQQGCPQPGCTYIRVECRRCDRAVQRADCAHVWLQPMYLAGHKQLWDDHRQARVDPYLPENALDEEHRKIKQLLNSPKGKDALQRNLTSENLQSTNYASDGTDQCNQDLTGFKDAWEH